MSSLNISLCFKSFLGTEVDTYSIILREPSKAEIVGIRQLVYISEPKHDEIGKVFLVKPLNPDNTESWAKFEKNENLLCTVEYIQKIGLVLSIREDLDGVLHPLSQHLRLEFNGKSYDIGQISGVKKMSLSGEYPKIAGIYTAFRKSSFELAKQALAARGIAV